MLKSHHIRLENDQAPSCIKLLRWRCCYRTYQWYMHLLNLTTSVHLRRSSFPPFLYSYSVLISHRVQLQPSHSVAVVLGGWPAIQTITIPIADPSTTLHINKVLMVALYYTCLTKWLPTTAGAGAPLLVDMPPPSSYLPGGRLDTR